MTECKISDELLLLMLEDFDQAVRLFRFIGEKHGNHKLLESDVKLIRLLRKIGHKYTEICEFFPVRKEQIGKICRRQKWAHVT